MKCSFVILALLAGVLISGCVDDATAPSPLPASKLYDRIPIISRNSIELEITGKVEACSHPLMTETFDCFAGITAAGEKIVFDLGIEGYEFRSGVKESIRVEKIIYDFTSPNAPMDMSSYRYVFLS